jgi:hypothetical protein
MPRIRGASIEEHHEMVWADLAEAMRQLLLERDYDSINMGHIAARPASRATRSTTTPPTRGRWSWR